MSMYSKKIWCTALTALCVIQIVKAHGETRPPRDH